VKVKDKYQDNTSNRLVALKNMDDDAMNINRGWESI
jgi:hypothetical protein